MKKLIGLTLISSMLLFFVTCTDTDTEDPNTIGGDPNVPLGVVGNVFTPGTFVVGNTSVALSCSMTVTKNEGGIVTMKVILDTTNLNKIPVLVELYNAIPSTMKDATGKINTNLKFKITSEGVQDFINMDNKAHTLIKYDCKVGDSYTLTKSTGRVLTRTVTARSDKDDFPFGLWMIKTITAEQNLGVYGVRKFIYRANHRFGIVHVIAIMDDGDTAKTYLYSDSTRAYANMENK